MFEWLFGSKRDVEKLKTETKEGFNHVRDDIENVSKWIKHLNSQDSKRDFQIVDVQERLASIENDLEGIKNSIAMMDMSNFKQVFKTAKPVYRKQTAVEGVQEAVQTAVQTGGSIDLSNFSVMERALVYVLLNSEMKLSYEDLAAMLGKSRATVRGQVNGLKQKSEGLIEEIIEKNGKKRVFIPDNTREKLLKNVKVRVSSEGKNKKKQEKEQFEG